MGTTLIRPVCDDSLLQSFLRQADISVSSVIDRMPPEARLSRGAVDAIVRGANNRTARSTTLYLALGALNARLKEQGQPQLTLAGLRHLASIRPSPRDSATQDREIRKAYSL